MIIFDFRFGPLDILINRDTTPVPFKATREGPGEAIIEWARFEIYLTNIWKAEKARGGRYATKTQESAAVQ